MAVAVWWVRRDLRLDDNLALAAAYAGGRGVLPVFILDERLLARPAPGRQAFLFAGLRSLDEALRRRGARLLVRRGPPLEALRAVLHESGAEVICAEEDYSPYARRRDAAVAAALPLALFPGLTARHPTAVCKPDGAAYSVFTPFSKAWMAHLPLEAAWSPPERFAPVPELTGDPLPRLPLPALFPPGEDEAGRRLAAFLDGPIYTYGEQRDRLDLEGTSQLSPYLRFGMLSARQAVRAALAAGERAPDAGGRRGCEVFLNELIWREFYQTILYHFPHVLTTAFQPGLRRIPWQQAPDDLLAWQEGSSGYPVVDAAMRQLRQTGWMHNRARMITASFLVKDLLIDWRAGEDWFMRNLIDGDPAANNGGWQWTAGVGTDAAPYFRIFNPVLQGKKFDPHGDYVRRWVPELAGVPEAFIHDPWRMPGGVAGYPAPLVEHAAARQRTLAAYRQGA